MEKFKNKFCMLIGHTLLLEWEFVQAQSERYPKREFRGAWIQAVNGQFKGIPTEQLKQILIDQLNSFARCRYQCYYFSGSSWGRCSICFAVGTWAVSLPGLKEKPPIHIGILWLLWLRNAISAEWSFTAWINPYRVETTLKNELAPMHIYNLHPDWFVCYGDQLYLIRHCPKADATSAWWSVILYHVMM